MNTYSRKRASSQGNHLYKIATNGKDNDYCMALQDYVLYLLSDNHVAGDDTPFSDSAWNWITYMTGYTKS